VLIGKINTSVWFHCMKKKKKSLMEDNEAQRLLTHRNPKRHIPLVSLLWHKMVAVHPFVWALGLRLWSGSEAVRRNFNFWQFFFKFYIRPPVSDFMFLKIYFILILFRNGDFYSEVCL